MCLLVQRHFSNHISHFILRKSAKQFRRRFHFIDPDSGQTLTVFRFDQKTADLYGTELSLDIHPHPLDWLHFENTFTFTRAQFTEEVDGTKNVPFIPAAKFMTSLKGDFLPHGRSIRNLYLGIQSDYTFKEDHPFTGYNTETATGDYWLVDINVGTDVIHNNKNFIQHSFIGDEYWRCCLSKSFKSFEIFGG